MQENRLRIHYLLLVWLSWLQIQLDPKTFYCENVSNLSSFSWRWILHEKLKLLNAHERYQSSEAAISLVLLAELHLFSVIYFYHFSNEKSEFKEISWSSPRWRWFTKLPGNTSAIIQPVVTAKIPESRHEVIFPTSLFLNLCSLSPWWPQNIVQELPWQQMQLALSSVYNTQRWACVRVSVCTCAGRQGSRVAGQTTTSDRRGEWLTAHHPAPSARVTHHRWMIHNPPTLSFHNHSQRSTAVSNRPLTWCNFIIVHIFYRWACWLPRGCYQSHFTE